MFSVQRQGGMRKSSESETTHSLAESLNRGYDDEESESRKISLPGNLDGSPAVLPTPIRRRMSDPDGYKHVGPQATVFSTCINMINTIIGAGMLSLPYAFSQSGVMVGLFWFFVGGIGEGFAIRLLNKCVLSEQKFSFRALAYKTLPFRGSKQFMETIVAVNCFGLATSYLVVIGDLLPQIIQYCLKNPSSLLISRQFWVTVIGCGAGLPLMFPRSLDALKYTSGLGVACVIYIVTLVVLYGSQEFDACEGADGKCPGEFTYMMPGSAFSMLKVLSMYSFAYSCTQNMPGMAYELKDRTIRKLDTAVWGAILGSTATYIVVAYLGYHAFGDYVDADLLQSLPDSVVATVARVAICLNLLTTYPLQMYPTKNSISQLIWQVDACDLPLPKYITMIVCIFAASWGIGMAVDDLGTILAYVGASTSTLLGYVLPAWFYIKLFPEKTWELYLAWFMFVVGLILIPLLMTIETLELLDLV